MREERIIVKATDVPMRGAPRKRHESRECLTCNAGLSAYNPGPNCYAHTPTKPRMPRGRHAK